MTVIQELFCQHLGNFRSIILHSTGKIRTVLSRLTIQSQEDNLFLLSEPSVGVAVVACSRPSALFLS